MGKNHRAQRMGEEIKKIVGDMLIKGRLKDPRFKGLIALSGCDVSGDGSYATIYITAMSYDPKKPLTEDDKKGILVAFEKSEGFLRSEIGKGMKVRYVPELIFKFDNSFEYGQKMDKILDDVKQQDEKLAKDRASLEGEN